MRLIGTIQGEHNGRLFSQFLLNNQISNQCEMTSNTDWNSPDYGTASCNIWIYDEEDVDNATLLLGDFKANPLDPRFQKFEQKIIKPLPQAHSHATAPTELLQHAKEHPSMKPKKFPCGMLTAYFIAVCAALFIWSEMTTPQIEDIGSLPPGVSMTPLATAPIKKKLLYDYPYAYTIIDKLVNLYGMELLQNPQGLPEEGKFLLKEYFHRAYWQGYYDKVLDYFLEKGDKANFDWHVEAPLFEKIRQGEYWRLFTPCLLHQDIFHIFFNMFWLVILGSQMEKILGGFRYILFSAVAGVFSNTAQYIMSGPNFIGYSGILCAMVAFIYVRQRIAGWEGYNLPRSTIGFLAVFVLAMLSIQIASFYMEIYYHTSFSPNIANTAHLSGACIGAAMGALPFFAWKPSKTK